VTAAEHATAAAPRVLVVEHERAVPVGLLGERLAAVGCRVETVGPDAGRPIPRIPDGYDGVIVFGGSMGPTDDGLAPWLPDVRRAVWTGLADNWIGVVRRSALSGAAA
jgi:GMP synthase-like glutamine amidotransferase